METESIYDIYRAVDKVLKPRKGGREDTIKHHRKKYYAKHKDELLLKHATK